MINASEVITSIVDNLMGKVTSPDLKLLMTIYKKTLGECKPSFKASISDLKSLTGLDEQSINKALKSLKLADNLRIRGNLDNKQVFHFEYRGVSNEVQHLYKQSKMP